MWLKWFKSAVAEIWKLLIEGCGMEAQHMSHLDVHHRPEVTTEFLYSCSKHIVAPEETCAIANVSSPIVPVTFQRTYFKVVMLTVMTAYHLNHIYCSHWNLHFQVHEYQSKHISYLGMWISTRDSWWFCQALRNETNVWADVSCFLMTSASCFWHSRVWFHYFKKCNIIKCTCLISPHLIVSIFCHKIQRAVFSFLNKGYFCLL